MDAWTEIGKTMGVLMQNPYNIPFDFSGMSIQLNNTQFRKDLEEATLTKNIAAAQQTTMLDPIAQSQQVSSPAIVDTGLARTPEGQMIDPETNNPTPPPNFGNVDYSPRAAGELAEVTDPAQTFADIAKRQGEFKRANIRPFEEALIKQIREGEDELVAQAPLDVARQATKVEGIARRNVSRYGFQETGATRQARNTAQSLARTVAVTDAVNNARLDQDSSNKQLLNVLVNAGSSVQQMGLGALGSAASMQGSRDNAFRQAQASSKAQKYGFIGSLFSMI
tara:strand:+ start:2548 stop:3387 length:840 start_codon:yes stop_codon:yes gene_type:complete